MGFRFRNLRLAGAVLVEQQRHEDRRGYFAEVFRLDEFESAGLPTRFAQENQSRSVRDCLRGLHFQRMHPQGKLFRVLSGEVYDVVVDLRHGSPSFGQWEGILLSDRTESQLFIPEGFAHGFLTMSDYALTAYKCTRSYDPKDEYGIRWDDPAIGIQWPLSGQEPILSDRDAAFPPWDPKREGT